MFIRQKGAQARGELQARDVRSVGPALVVGRAVFASVLHRLFESGSDRQAVRFLGEDKDRIEEKLFARDRDLFTDLRLVFFDTMSLYLHGEGGELGAQGTLGITGRSSTRWWWEHSCPVTAARSAARCTGGTRRMCGRSCRWWTERGSGSLSRRCASSPTGGW